MPRRPRRSTLLLPATACVALVACGGAPTAGDYADRGEEFITEGLDGQAERAGLTFTGAQCTDPPATAANTVFTCTAQGSDATSYTFTVTIIGRNRIELVSSPPLPSPGSPTTTASAPPATVTTSTTVAGP